MISRSGQSIPASAGPFLDNIGGLTRSNTDVGGGGNATNAGIQAASGPPPNVLPYIGGLIILLIILKYAMEHEKSGLDPKVLGINVANWITVTLLAIFGIVSAKAIVNRSSTTTGVVGGIKSIINAA
jgi:hypothetical protein